MLQYNSANATTVALTYIHMCSKQHVSHSWNIPFINWFHYLTLLINFSIIWKSWKIQVHSYSQKKFDKIFTISKWILQFSASNIGTEEAIIDIIVVL